tara:strand:+ start:259 stop:801 length:543 start_codon:yes stop_codon:yes gene_type:complete
MQTLTEEKNHAALAEWEREDEGQIVESLKGRAIEKLFHTLPIKDHKTGEDTIALSWAGVKYFAAKLGGIQVDDVKILKGLDDKDPSWMAVAYATDTRTQTKVQGAAEQSKNVKFKSGGSAPDEYALAKVFSKAQRNALRALIPEPMISEAYKEWKLQNGKPQASAGVPASAPLADPSKLV